MRKVDKNVGFVDQRVGNQMHHFLVANPVGQLKSLFLDFPHAESEFRRRQATADVAV
jgi:hypothetical protein